MPPESAPEIMRDAAREIFETMFFIAPEESASAEQWENAIGAEVEFSGAACGRFEIEVEEPFAQELAASFSGVMDPSEMAPEAVSQVLCELANMICGATLSRMEPTALFKLNPPRFLKSNTTQVCSRQIVRWFDSGQGLIRLALTWA
jgi:CheY-specific phosphatase CheX